MNSAETFVTEAPIDNSRTETSQLTDTSRNQSLRDSVEIAMENYFRNLEGQSVTDVYELVMNEVEAPMLEVIMKHTRHNQTKAAQVLGLNRGTLRKKLKQYGLL
ncbi:MAG: DNA-binding transcriptional regulator Fis [Cellvibrionaceae bacterium]|nr:DNA-binding transcriptional regulator Fis [Cellvibrionaceae bacterium]MCV6625282.1 DNA-binding transcriptional regulator Fis [Cellvibrionaceae bacterium]